MVEHTRSGALCRLDCELCTRSAVDIDKDERVLLGPLSDMPNGDIAPPSPARQDDEKIRFCGKKKDDCSLLELLSDDLLSKTLSFLSFADASYTASILFVNARNASRLQSLAVWREIFVRRGFSLQDTTATSTTDYANEHRRRINLLQYLFSKTFDPVTYFLPRASLCGSDDYDKSRKRKLLHGSASLFDFVLTSTAVAPHLLLLNWDTDDGKMTVALHADPVLRDEDNLKLAAIEIDDDERMVLSLDRRQVLYDEDVVEGNAFRDNPRLLLSKPMFVEEDATAITLLGFAFEHRHLLGDDDETCTEYQFWRSNNHGDFYAAHASSRVRGKRRIEDFGASCDQRKQLVYVAASRWCAEIGDELDEVHQLNTVEAYQMQPYGDRMGEEGHDEYRAMTCLNFQEPKFVLHCGESILSLRLSPSGNDLLVATADGNLQVWNVATQATSTISIPFHPLLEQAFVGLRDTIFLQSLLGHVNGETGVGGTIHRPPPPPTRVTIHVPRHVSLQHTASSAGFVTMHTTQAWYPSSVAGSHTALFWEKRKEGASADRNSWGIYAMVNLPFRPQWTPQVHFDGSRFIAFGQDFFGFIILVYQVHTSLESLSGALWGSADTHAPSFGKETSGGVFNFESLLNVPRVKFANRIRHSALGRIEHSEHLQMTCNERFLVLYTRSPSLEDGLLIFDLDDTGRTAC